MTSFYSRKNKTIDVTTLNLRRLLTKPPQSFPMSNKFEIPEFQRNYVWDSAHIERLIKAIQKNQSGYYLGNIVITPSKNGGIDFLIDGQQRLTTLFLIIKFLSEKTSDPTTKKDLVDLLYRGQDLKIFFKKRNLNKAYEAIMKNKVTSNEDDGIRKLKNAWRVVKKELTAIDNEKKIKNLKKLIEDTEFVVIKCSSYSQIYSLFEGLNSTAKALTTVELIKNAVFGKTYDLSGSEKKVLEISRIWENIEKIFEKSNIGWFNKFMRHSWFLEEGYILDRQLFFTIKEKKIESFSNIKKIKDYLNNLNSDAVSYIKIRQGLLSLPRGSRLDAGRRIPETIDAINTLGLDQVYPVILSLYKYSISTPEYFKNARFFKDMEKLWAFLFLAKYSSINPSSYERTFAAFCFDVGTSRGYKQFKDLSKNFFLDLSKKIANQKKPFIKKLNEKYTHTKESPTKYLFSSLLDDENVDYRKLTVEHIIPQGEGSQGNLSKWKKIIPSQYEKIKENLQKIGNLSLIEAKINEEADNLSFPEKCRLYKKSRYKINKEVKYYLDFNTRSPERGVKKRGEEIGERLFDIYFSKLKNN